MTNRLPLAMMMTLLLAGSALGQTPEIVIADEVPEGTVIEEFAAPDYGPEPSLPGRFWATADYLVGWIESTRLPILVTTSTSANRGTAGIIDEPDTRILFGGEHVNEGARSGARLGMGYWFGAERVFGVHTSFFMLETKSALFSAASEGSPILARPFANALTREQDAVLVAFPGALAGNISISATSRNFFGGSIDFSEQILQRGDFRLDSLVGYRFLRYDERLLIQDARFPSEAGFAAGTQIFTRDDFGTQNEFHGAEVGLRAEWTRRQWSVEGVAKLAVGSLNRDVNIFGVTVVDVPGSALDVRQGGLLALSNNIGSHLRDEWVTVPEFAFNVGWEVNSHLRLRLGYTFLSLGHVARVSEQVDTLVNPNLIPPSTSTAGPPNPVHNLVPSDTWVQSVNFGFEFRY